ncbi:AraC family transcriptional regulator [Sorangium cellulosum]|uniref:AraC family transcriptional regulator n=1 Tax=Sorangium cellulosum TaxID=56 RepID=A0A4P2Q7D0_SORCE|nr:AraC family transcriptional regulator [Sorangium cellulosum]AUX24923.1 AraC family transcriptional regulator [Sorangium cellulosum]
MDPLSDVLSLLRPLSQVSGGLDAGGAWAIRYGRYEGIKCYAVLAGSCWLRVQGVRRPVRMDAGDCFLLPRGCSFVLASTLSVRPVPADEVWANARHGDVLRCGCGSELFLVGSHFDLGREHGAMLLGALPPVIRVREAAARDVLAWSIQRMRQELGERRPGSALMVQHLGNMILVQALRQYLVDENAGGANWLRALGDTQIGAAITAMHEAPERAWTLPQLAKIASMSRSVFALRFHEKVGVTPRAYLTRWRMLLAAERLTTSRDVIATVASSLGYESESAFSLAFKKVLGSSPRRYALRRRASRATE